VFPLEVRGEAVSLAVQMNFLLNAIVQFGVPVLERALGLGLTFAIFAVLDVYRLVGHLDTRREKSNVPEAFFLTLSVVSYLRHCCSLYFIKIHVPETKGLTLEQIEEQFVALSRGDRSSELEPLLLQS
jgi:Sugar (and other) transporter